MQGYKIFTHDLCSPIQGGTPVWDGETPYDLPTVELDHSPKKCAEGWNFTEDIETGLRIAGMWPNGWPSRVFAVETTGEVIVREEKRRTDQLRILHEVDEAEINEAIFRFSTLFGPHQQRMADSQIAWRRALGRPFHDPDKAQEGLREALRARGLTWQLREFKSASDAREANAARVAWDVWDAWAARAAWEAWDAWAAWDAWDAWEANAARKAREAWDANAAREAWIAGAANAARKAWAARAAWNVWDARDAWIAGAANAAREAWDARDTWDANAAREANAARKAWHAWAAWDANVAREAWDARDAWDVWDAWVVWDARAALVLQLAAQHEWVKRPPMLLSIGLRDAYENGLAIALPTGHHELGWAMMKVGR
jgi:hypothetical protein